MGYDRDVMDSGNSVQPHFTGKQTSSVTIEHLIIPGLLPHLGQVSRGVQVDSVSPCELRRAEGVTRAYKC